MYWYYECFEGMKAYKGADGSLRLFRPDCNMERLKSSMARLAMPDFDGDAFLECLKTLLRTGFTSW